jgi:hypothetical protein
MSYKGILSFVSDLGLFMVFLIALSAVCGKDAPGTIGWVGVPLCLSLELLVMLDSHVNGNIYKSHNSKYKKKYAKTYFNTFIYFLKSCRRLQIK